MVEGRQYQFTLDGIWNVAMSPKLGMPVNVDVDRNAQVRAITMVPESEVAGERPRPTLLTLKQESGKFFERLAFGAGISNLVVSLILAIAWFVPASVSIQIPPIGRLDFTFWQLLGFLNAGNTQEAISHNVQSSAGAYGVAAILALLGPYIHCVWKGKRAILAGLAPLLFMLVVCFQAHRSMRSALASGVAVAALSGIKQQIRPDIMDGFSLGSGAYISFVVGLYFAGLAAKSLVLPTGRKAIPYRGQPEFSRKPGA
jgi:hypothetical protein